MTQFRSVPLEQMARAIAKAIDSVQPHQDKLGFQRSCISCTKFNEPKEFCNQFQAQPPARVIAFACEAWDDIDPIPF